MGVVVSHTQRNQLEREAYYTWPGLLTHTEYCRTRCVCGYVWSMYAVQTGGVTQGTRGGASSGAIEGRSYGAVRW